MASLLVSKRCNDSEKVNARRSARMPSVDACVALMCALSSSSSAAPRLRRPMRKPISMAARTTARRTAVIRPALMSYMSSFMVRRPLTHRTASDRACTFPRLRLAAGRIIDCEERTLRTARRGSSGVGLHFLEWPGRGRAAAALTHAATDRRSLHVKTLATPAVEPALRPEELHQRLDVAGAPVRAAGLRRLSSCRACLRRVDGRARLDQRRDFVPGASAG